MNKSAVVVPVAGNAAGGMFLTDSDFPPCPSPLTSCQMGALLICSARDDCIF